MTSEDKELFSNNLPTPEELEQLSKTGHRNVSDPAFENGKARAPDVQRALDAMDLEEARKRKAETSDTYTVDALDIVRSPGKYQGEPGCAPYFDSMVMEGFGEDRNDGGSNVEVCNADRVAFPELMGIVRVVIRMSDTGFVSCTRQDADDVASDEDMMPECGECGEEMIGSECACTRADEPDEDAITTSDDKTFYQYGKCVLTVDADEDRNIALLNYMDAERFWPDTWSISDHGNAHRIDLAETTDAREARVRARGATWTVEDTDDDVMHICCMHPEAGAIRDHLQSLGGSRIEVGDATHAYVIVDSYSADEAIRELKASGYVVRDLR